MADTLLFRGGSSADIAASTVQDRELVIDTDTDQIVSGASKKKTVMEDSNGNISIDGSATFAGKVGIGTTSPGKNLDIEASDPRLRISSNASNNATVELLSNAKTSFIYSQNSGNLNLQANNELILLASAGTERARIDSSGDVLIGGTLPSAPNISLNAGGSATFAGKVGIGTTSPVSPLSISDGGAGGVEFHPNSGGLARLLAYNRNTSSYIGMKYNANAHHFYINESEKVRIDSSGRLLVGTSSSFTMGRTGTFQVAGGTGSSASAAFISATRFGTTSGGGELSLGASYGSNGNHGLVPNGHQLGRIQFVGSDGTQGLYGAWIKCEVDGTPGSNDMPGRLILATTANGASIPTERMRIDSSGNVKIGGTLPSAPAISLDADGSASFAGDITCTNNSKGLILKSPDGTSFRLSVANDGTLSASSI